MLKMENRILDWEMFVLETRMLYNKHKDLLDSVSDTPVDFPVECSNMFIALLMDYHKGMKKSKENTVKQFGFEIAEA
tara:strand:+ start:805 stop:1035 length:231 start_codon:yes stop_codon:yes gene_type:complete